MSSDAERGSWSDNDAVGALSHLSAALDELATVIPGRELGPGAIQDDGALPLQNLPAHLVFARHWESCRAQFLARVITRPCPLCGSSERDLWFPTQDGYRYAICSDCGMVHIPEVLPLPVWDDYYATLPGALECLRDQMMRSVDEGAFERDRTRFGRYLSILRAHGCANRDTRALDLGSFTGAWLRVAGEEGLDAVGVEGLAEAVRFARERFPGLRLEHQRAEALDPSAYGAAFDLVTMWETLEHTFDPLESLRLASRALRPGGMLAVTVPNARNVQFSALGQFCFFAYGGYQGTGHINMFTPDTLERLFVRAGFEPVHVSTEYGTDWRQMVHFLRQQFDRIHCYTNLIRHGSVADRPNAELSVLLNWLSPALTRLENACLAGPIIVALARRR